MAYPSDLTNDEWNLIQHHFEPSDRRGRPCSVTDTPPRSRGRRARRRRADRRTANPASARPWRRAGRAQRGSWKTSRRGSLVREGLPFRPAELGFAGHGKSSTFRPLRQNLFRTARQAPLCVAACKHKPSGSQTSAILGSRSVTMSGASGSRSVTMGSRSLTGARQQRLRLTLADNIARTQTPSFLTR